MDSEKSQGTTLPKNIKQAIIDKCKELGHDPTQFEAYFETISDEALAAILKVFFDLKDKQDSTKPA